MPSALTGLRRTSIAALLIVPLLLAACGGDDDDTTGGTSADDTSATSVAAEDGGTSAVTDTTGASGVDVAPVVEHLTDVHGGADWAASVGEVTAEGTTVVIATTVDDAATAIEVCEAAAMVAYSSTVQGEEIVVNDPGGAPLARGVAGSDCTEA